MIRLEDTDGGRIAHAIAEERHRMGSPTTGMVMTLLILSDEESQADATAAAVGAARQHPMRILTLIPRPGRESGRIDAQVMVGGDDGPGEVAVVRLRGDRSGHASSVVVPLLLPDTPVVAWWPADPPLDLAEDPIGRHAQRRITDVSTADDPLAALAERRRGYSPGDIDLSWSRITPWRSALASLLDQPTGPVHAAGVSAEAGSPSAVLLCAWLRSRLGVSVDLAASDGPGITGVVLAAEEGDLRLERPDGVTAVIHRPGVPDSAIALPRRTLPALIAEELQRLDPDVAYAQALTHTEVEAP